MYLLQSVYEQRSAGFPFLQTVCLSGSKRYDVISRNIPLPPPQPRTLPAWEIYQGPERLLRKLSGEISAEQAWQENEEEYLNADDERKGTIDPMKEKYICVSCYLHGKETYTHRVAEFAVSSREMFYEKLVSQGSWTKCIRCQDMHPKPTRAAQKLNSESSTHPVQKTPESESNVCGLCRELVPGTLEVGQHCCRICKTIHPASHWTSSVLKKHRDSTKRSLVCEACMLKGFTAWDITPEPCKHCKIPIGHTCACCKGVYGHGRFNNTNLKHHRPRGDALRCSDCKEKLQCAACQKMYPKTEWTAKERKNHNSEQRSPLICKRCRQRGCTAHDYKLHECMQCSQSLGAKRFDHNMLHNHEHGGRNKVLCLLCASAITAKEQALYHNFSSMKKAKKCQWFCKCFKLLHDQRCPLSPAYFGEKRWPGGDSAISEEDRKFLDGLNPRPVWWATAYGRRPEKKKKKE
jgi:hypothetical protein